MFFNIRKTLYSIIFTNMISRRKNSVIGFYAVFVFTIFCAVFYAFKSEGYLLSKTAIDCNFSKKVNSQNKVDVVHLNDLQEELTLDELDKLSFDATIILEESIVFILRIHYFSYQPLVLYHFLSTALPRYLLYHSLRIPDC
ncbi:hypothetical protein [Flavobacterium sp.]|uniref:hypothetical protein n=1 Tax=Flavobacterium sp. TaxID=239 RepID=UPI003D0B8E1B